MKAWHKAGVLDDLPAWLEAAIVPPRLMENDLRYTDGECLAILDKLFPKGAAGGDVFAALAPQGWEASPFFLHFHPTLEMCYHEAVESHKNLSRWPWRNQPPGSPPTFEEAARDYRGQPVNPDEEMRDLIGSCLWGIFSDNHEVIAADGRTVDLGSFRGAGGTIADWLNAQTGTLSHDYINFYCGSWFLHRVDVAPVYQLIFERLKALGADWIYSHPRLHLVDFGGMAPDEPETSYSPSDAFAREQERNARRKEVEEMRAKLDEDYRASCQKARTQPPPPTVKAYQAVFGRVPEGWPPAAG